MSKCLETRVQACYKNTYTYNGSDALLDAAKMKKTLEQNAHEVTVDIGYNNHYDDPWVKLIWYELA